MTNRSEEENPTPTTWPPIPVPPRPALLGQEARFELHPQPIKLPRRAWELPLAILLWIWVAATILLGLLTLVGGIGAIGSL